MNEPVVQTCAECGTDRLRLQNEVRQLRQKLEYSQLQNSLLRSQCDLLRKRLCEAEFRGRSSVAIFSPPPLPNEVLRHIFFLATKFDGLVSPCWEDNAEMTWEISSLARRSIPLVCQKWYMVGLEFLYEHVILRNTSQVSQVLETSMCLDPLTRGRRLGCIRGLEFVIQEGSVEEAEAFKELACRLVRMLPGEKLRRFAIDCGGFHVYRTNVFGPIVAETLQKSSGSLEVLHLPCIRHPKALSTQDSLYRAVSTSTLHVHTISITGGKWKSCRGIGGTGTDPLFLTGLEKTASSVRTLLFNCDYTTTDYDQQLHSFLASAVNLDTVHIVACTRADILARDLDNFLNDVPVLRHLLITPSARFWSFDTPGPVRDVVVHQNLEDITVYLSATGSYSSIYSSISILQPLMLKIKSGNIPHLQRIVLYGDFPEGCLDGYQILSPDISKLWEDAIDWCAGQNVEVVSHLGHPIHLWHRRHGVRPESSNGGGTPSSDEGEWFEFRERGGTLTLGDDDESSESEVGSEGELISDDPEDTPYRYVRRRDIEQVDPNSDDEETL